MVSPKHQHIRLLKFVSSTAGFGFVFNVEGFYFGCRCNQNLPMYSLFNGLLRVKIIKR
jgi:hypothetical protein